MSQSEHEKAEKDLLELPKREMERWQSAPEFGSDKRIVAFKFSSFGHEESLDLLGFIDCVGERLDRWRQGCFKVCEAAQILADAYPNKIDARSLCEQMVQAIYAGDLILRKNGIPLPSNQIENRKWGAYFRIVEARDVNEWLTAKGTLFRLHDPYGSSEPGSVTLPMSTVVSNATTTKRKAQTRQNVLDPAINKAIDIAGSHDSAAVYLALRELALEEEPPFTGHFNGDALCYTSAEGQAAELTKNALQKRLRRRIDHLNNSR